jgi:uncharacterized protein YgfB (UPF0149 family)
MPQDGYGSVSAPEDKIEQATDYKPDGATWGEVLVAGAERLNENLDSDMAAESLTDGLADDEVAVAGTREALVEDLAARLTEVGVAGDGGSDLPDDLREQLDRIESAAMTAEARTGRIEGTLEDMGAGR